MGSAIPFWASCIVLRVESGTFGSTRYYREMGNLSYFVVKKKGYGGDAFNRGVADPSEHSNPKVFSTTTTQYFGECFYKAHRAEGATKHIEINRIGGGGGQL